MNTPATPRLKVIQRTALTLLVVAGVINYIDRATLAVANPLIREELGLSIAQMGYLLSAFLGAYAFAQLPVGALVDGTELFIRLEDGPERDDYLELWVAASGGAGDGYPEIDAGRYRA